MSQPFTLIPFDPEKINCKITGSINTTAPGLLVLQYQFSADLTEITWPAPSEKPQRKDKLWQQTCMELFIAEKNSERYFEFNFSPNGDWQCYEFLSYRSLSNQPKDIKPPIIDKLDNSRGVSYSVALDTAPLSLGAPLRLGINTVLLHHNGDQAYFSLLAQSGTPDFHARDSFKMTLSFA